MAFSRLSWPDAPKLTGEKTVAKGDLESQGWILGKMETMLVLASRSIEKLEGALVPSYDFRFWPYGVEFVAGCARNWFWFWSNMRAKNAGGIDE
tara:strand:+ start:443 stop:724 length:282 start_codon:yes stop_codon:yes gene_type:complete